jgi:hypothetical protein
VVTCWEEGGAEPIYVCENHAKQLGRYREHCSDVRVLTPQSEHSNDPIRNAERSQIQDIAHTKPGGSTSSEVIRTLADTKIATATTAPSVRAPLRDPTFGNAAKAMVDEVIWNMAAGNYQVYRAVLQQGKPAAEAAQAAGGQVAVVHRKISDYTLKLEAVLSESKAIISVAEAIDKPLEQAVLEIIGNGTMNDSEKDDAIRQLGALQEWIKHGLDSYMTPAQAHRSILAIGDRLNWGGPADVAEDLKAVYRALYASLKTAIRSAVPGAENLQDRLTNLYAAKSDLEICQP